MISCLTMSGLIVILVLQVSNPKKVEWDFGDPGNSFEQTIHIHNEDYSKMISKILLY